MASSYDEWEKRYEEAQAEAETNAKKAPKQYGTSNLDLSHEYKSWSDWLGNVNMSDITTGQTNREYSGTTGEVRKTSRKDNLASDLGQAVTGAMSRQGGNYRSALATLGLGVAGLIHGDNNYQPEVGSALWRWQEGAEAATKAGAQQMEDSKYGRGWLGRFTMDLTSGAVDLAGDQLLNLVAPGAGMAAMAARSFGGSAEEQREQGKSISTQFFKGLKSAAIEYGTEKFAGIGGRSIEGGGYIDNLLSRAEESIVRKGGNAFLTKLGFAFGSEAAEEMMSDWLNPLADKFLAGVVKGDYDIEDFPSFAEVAYDGLIGGALGLLGGAREGLQAQSQVKALGGNQGYADYLAQKRADTKSEVKKAKDAKKSQLKSIFDYATQHAEQALDRAKAAKAEEASQAEPEAAQPASEVPFTVGAQEAAEAPVAPAPTEIAPTPQTSVKQEAGEFNALRDVEAMPSLGNISTNESESGKVETRKNRPTGAELLANYNNQRTSDSSNRGLKQRVEKAIRNALAVNGVDYSNDPRSEYYDENTGEYREEDLDLLDEESRAKYLSDMRQIRLLDAVDEWLDRNGQRYLSANKGSEAEVQQGLQDALNDYVRRYLDSQTDKASNSEAVEDVMQQRRQDDRLKSLAKEEKQEAPTGYNTVQIGDNLFRVTGPGGIITTEVADNSADAVQKHIDGLTEENRKKAKERKAKEQELKKLRQEVRESQENPTQIDGSDGKSYEVTKELTKGESNYQYVVTELDEDGLPTDTEARVFRKNADNEQEAVDYAIAHPEFFNDGSVEGEVWEERNSYGEHEVQAERRQGSGNPDSDDGRRVEAETQGSPDESLGRGVGRGGEKDGLGLRIERARRINPEATAKHKADIEAEFGIASKIYEPTGWERQVSNLAELITGVNCFWAYKGKDPLSFAFYSPSAKAIFLCKGHAGTSSKTFALATVLHEVIHEKLDSYSGDRLKGNSARERATSFVNEIYERAGIGEGVRKQFDRFWGNIYTLSKSVATDPDISETDKNAMIDAILKNFPEERGKIDNEIAARMVSGELIQGFDNVDIIGEIQKAARAYCSELGLIDENSFSYFPDVIEFRAEYNAKKDSLTKQSDNVNGEPPQPKRSAPPPDLNETLNEMSRERDSKSKAKDADFDAKRAEDKQQTNAKEYAYNKKLEAEEAGTESSDEDKAKSTFGKDYEKVQKSAADFDGIKTRFDDEAFQKSDKSRDKKTRNKLKKLREAFRNAATTGNVETLFSIYEDLQSDSNLSNFYNEEIQEDIDNWRKLIDPNLDSYNEGAAPYAAARTMQRMAHKFKLDNEYQQTLSKMNETLRGSKNGVLRKIGKSEKLTSAVARALMRWQINPDTVFKMIDAFDKGNAGEGYKLAKELQEAHREKYRVLRESRAKFDKASDLKGYQDFAFGKQTVKDYSGREWDMRSALSVIKAIDTIRSTSGKKLGGTDGFGVMDSKGNVEFIDMKDVDAIKLYESLKSGLSDVAIKYGELATEAFNDVKEPLRAKYKQNNGVDIGMVGDEDARLGDKKGVEKAVYSPLSYVDKNGNVYQFDIAKQETYNNIPRFLRERSDAGGTYILIKPYTEVTGKYFEQVSNYLAYSTFNEKMQGLGKGSSYETGLGGTLAEVFGKDMGNWYRSYVEDLGSYHNEDDVEGVNSLLRQGRQQLQQGALLFSVSVPMKQISSYWAASGILHPDSLIKNYRIKLLKPKNSSDAATMLASRAMGNLEQSAAEAAKDAKKWLGKLKYSSKFVELAANAINQMDYNTVSNLLSATEYDVLKYQFGGDKSVIGTDEYKTAVEEKFQDVVDRSQPNFDKQMRAEYGRTDNEVIRMLSMFRTQQTQNLNLLATAIGEYQAAKGTKNQAAATETLKQTIAGQAASAFSLSMLTILADMLLHRQKKYEDEEEDIDISKVLTRLGINAIEASSGTLWFGDAVAKWAIDRISGGSTKEFYGVNMGVISTVSDILENFETAIKSPTRSNIKKCAGNIATIMGIPLNNAYSMLNSAIMYAKDLTGDNEGDYDDILRYLDAQTKAAKKAEEKAAKEAAKAEANSGADMLADTAKQNSSQSELNSQEEQKTTEVSTYLKKPYNALVEAGMSPERSQYVLSFMDTDKNDSVKQSEMWAFYKDNPDYEDYVIAMWNSYGYKTTWEAYKAKHK